MVLQSGSQDCQKVLPNKDEFDTNISLVLTRKWTKEILNNRNKVLLIDYVEVVVIFLLSVVVQYLACTIPYLPVNLD